MFEQVPVADPNRPLRRRRRRRVRRKLEESLEHQCLDGPHACSDPVRRPALEAACEALVRAALEVVRVAQAQHPARPGGRRTRRRAAQRRRNAELELAAPLEPDVDLFAAPGRSPAKRASIEHAALPDKLVRLVAEPEELLKPQEPLPADDGAL